MSKEFKPDALALQARQFHLFNQFLPETMSKIPKQGITYWEELECIGYNPAQSRLEAIVSVKQNSGYSGSLCTNGSSEYVRFFVDYGAGFEDAGLASFKTYDFPLSPSGHPLHYMVYIQLDDASHRRLCLSPVMPQVRAILSWNTIPTNDPFQPIHYGNALQAHIQLLPRPWKFIDIFDIQKISPEAFPFSKMELDQPIPLMEKKAMPFGTLQQSNLKAQVPPHRTLYNQIYPSVKAISSPAKHFMLAGGPLSKEMNIDWLKVAGILAEPTSNTDYEELTCVGLNPERDMLGGIIHVKKPNGFSGTLCYEGSVEYVAFWADWNNDGTYDEYLGTAKVEVHDIPSMPADGLFYSVSLPLSIANRLKFCSSPNIVGIRGVLSWNIEPSTTDPADLHYWGNRMDVKVQLRKKETYGHDLNFHYHDIGFVPLNQIANGFAYYNPVASSYANRPWGGQVHIGGRFDNAGTPGTVHYRVEWCAFNSSNDADWQPVTTSQTFALYNSLSGYYDNVVTQNNADGWFSYLEDFTPGNLVDEYNATLASWNTSGKQGTYFIRVIYTTDPLHISFNRSVAVQVRINNIRYTVNSAFHNYLAGPAALSAAHDVDMIFDGAGGCISAQQGSQFTGHFKALHAYFAQVRLYVLPANSGAVLQSGGITTPVSGTVVLESSSTAFNGYTNEAWSMNTGNMQKCGYVLALEAYERTIYDGSHYLPGTSMSIGFAIV